jgi:hypothetical protein
MCLTHPLGFASYHWYCIFFNFECFRGYVCCHIVVSLALLLSAGTKKISNGGFFSVWVEWILGIKIKKSRLNHATFRMF